jgi:hypothetical protein
MIGHGYEEPGDEALPPGAAPTAQGARVTPAAF